MIPGSSANLLQNKYEANSTRNIITVIQLQKNLIITEKVNSGFHFWSKYLKSEVN